MPSLPQRTDEYPLAHRKGSNDHVDPLTAGRLELPVAPKSDPFPAAEAPTPVKRSLPFRAGAIAAGTSQVARTFRNYEALTDENKRLVDGLVLALRGTVDGGR